MNTVINTLIPFVLAAVAAVLVLGLITLFRGGSANLSNKLMRWRVLLQFLAVLLIGAATFVFNK